VETPQILVNRRYERLRCQKVIKGEQHQVQLRFSSIHSRWWPGCGKEDYEQGPLGASDGRRNRDQGKERTVAKCLLSNARTRAKDDKDGRSIRNNGGSQSATWLS